MDEQNKENKRIICLKRLNVTFAISTILMNSMTWAIFIMPDDYNKEIMLFSAYIGIICCTIYSVVDMCVITLPSSSAETNSSLFFIRIGYTFLGFIILIIIL